MDNDAPPASSKRGRLMGKLFGKQDRKAPGPDQPSGRASSEHDLDDFFRRPTDHLTVPPQSSSGLPVLAKLDTSSVSRYPNAFNVQSVSQQSLPLRSPRGRGRKGLSVRFADTFPEIIGEGGDECEFPTIEISNRKNRPPPAPIPPKSPLRTTDNFGGQHRPAPQPPQPPQDLNDDGFKPGPLRRIQTGHASVFEPSPATPRSIPAGEETPTQFLGTPVIGRDERRRSFIEVQQAQMRQAEGQAFAKAYRSASAGTQQDWENPRQPPTPGQPPAAAHTPPQSHSAPREPESRPSAVSDSRSQSFQNSPDRSEYRQARPPQPGTDYSPMSAQSQTSSFNQHGSQRQWNSNPPESQNGSPTSPQRPAAAFDDVALKDFAARSRHLFEIFRLHSEAVRPLMTSSSESLVRAAAWWFLKGRMALEAVIRAENPKTPPTPQHEIMKQQAYADLAKGYWITEEILPEVMATRPSALDSEVEEVRKNIVMNLRKLSLSMKRNGFLPPEDAVLPQTLKLSIWVEYPPVSQDIVSLLHGSSGSSLAAPQVQTSPKEILEALPLGDTNDFFNYGRVAVDAFLMEQGMENQRFHFPCLLSMVRLHNSPSLMLAISSQNGAIQLKVQNTKSIGPTWEEIRWRNESCSLEMKLPRGFVLLVQLSPADYRMLWSMYDFGEKVQSTLYPRKDEKVVFHTTLRAFQYFDADPQSKQFPKEAVASCELALFEKILTEGAATGPRHFHRGFRVAVVTGPRTRTLSGVNHAFTCTAPIQFAFLKDDQGTPSLLLKFDSGRSKGRMVMSFKEERDRSNLHSILLASRVSNDEMVCADVPLLSYSVSRRLGESEGMPCLQKLPWQRAKVLNVGDELEPPSTVLAEKLRVILDFNHGMITDRMHFSPGEFKIRLDVNDVLGLRVLRPPQLDMTVAISEGDVSRDLPRELGEMMQAVQASQTIRTFHFGNLRDLHDFQAAVTGYKVLFDGIASSFGISRRRMVVPIHKKWEAGATRIQVVQQEKVTQLMAFFEDFHHGHAMGFVLKGTDVFEAVGRGSKAGIKIDDAKFPLPRMPQEGSESANDASFVCLDLPDLPGEHDDITIYFESEADRDQLGSCLPAPVKGSRLAGLRMK